MIGTIHADGTDPDIVAMKGDTAPEYDTGSVFSRFKVPGQNSTGGAVFAATVGGTSSGTAIFEVTGGAGGGLDRIVNKGSIPPGFAAETAFTGFSAAANNSHDWVAFTARIAGPGVGLLNDTGVWLWNDVSIVPLAREGDIAPDSGSATWKSFRSVALPVNGNVLFTAKLNAPTATDTGLWAVDSLGKLPRTKRRDHSREHPDQELQGTGRIREIQTRSYNGAGSVVYLATFTDGTQGSQHENRNSAGPQERMADISAISAKDKVQRSSVYHSICVHRRHLRFLHFDNKRETADERRWRHSDCLWICRA